MLVYIIDGFNLIHQVKALKYSHNPHRDLINYLKNNRLTGSSHNQVIIVFDGQVNEEAQRQAFGWEVIFSGSGSADDLIKQRVKKIRNRSEIVVVSDDRSIRDTIKSLGARECRTADFIKVKVKPQADQEQKEISYTDQRQITEELRKYWLKND